MMPQRGLVSQKQVPFVIGIQGTGLGAGKTSTLVAFSAAAYSCGYEICTNITSMKMPHTDFYSTVLPYLDEILAGEMTPPENVLYALDDINKMWEGRRAMGRVEVQLSQFIQDVRKYRSFCAFAVPHVMWSDVRLYDICDLLIFTSFEEDTDTLHWMMADPETKKVLGTWSADARPLFGLYDSWEKIRSPMPEVFEEVEREKKRSNMACPRCGSEQTRATAGGTWKCQRCRHVGWRVRKWKTK
jgi:ribosomal protein S27AE